MEDSDLRDYEVLNQLAKGGQGVTSRVRRIYDNRVLVLKQSFCDDCRSANSALLEAKLLKQIRHPYVNRYEDVFLSEQGKQLVVCTVMEYCEGGDLARYLITYKKHRTLVDPMRAVRWMQQLTSAIAHLHQQKIVHRDMKPQNVFLFSEDSLRIGDFGLAQTIERGKRTSQVGTPCYMAPEVLYRDEYAETVDVWGIGCIGYECLSLQFLWQRKGMLAAQVEVDPILPQHLPDLYPFFLRDAVASCLACSPHRRPPASSLQTSLQQESGQAPSENLGLVEALENFGKAFGSWLPLGGKEEKEKGKEEEVHVEKALLSERMEPSQAGLSMGVERKQERSRTLAPQTRRTSLKGVDIKSQPLRGDVTQPAVERVSERTASVSTASQSHKAREEAEQRADDVRREQLRATSGRKLPAMVEEANETVREILSKINSTSRGEGSNSSSSSEDIVAPARTPSRTPSTPSTPARLSALSSSSVKERDGSGGEEAEIPPHVLEEYREKGLFGVDPRWRSPLQALIKQSSSSIIRARLENELEPSSSSPASTGEQPPSSSSVKRDKDKSGSWLSRTLSGRGFAKTKKMEMGGELDFELGGDKKILIEKFSKQFELVFPRQQWLLAKEATRREGETYGTDEEIQREFTRLFGQPKSRFIGSSDRLMAV